MMDGLQYSDEYFILLIMNPPLLRAPWISSEIQGESLFFIDGSARLLFSPASKVSITSSDGSLRYEENKDFIIEKEGRLRLLPGSRIPTTASKDLFIPATSGSPDKYAHKRGDPDTWMLWSEKGLYHQRQVVADYTRAGKWDLFTPKFEGERLKRTVGNLSCREPVTIAVSGDSISEGYNASKYLNLPPFQPCYAELLATALEKHYNGKVILKNFAVGGWTSAKGLEDAPKRADEKPDLVIIAYGMNDVKFEPEVFLPNISGIRKVFSEKNPDADFILVSSMLPNPEWRDTDAAARLGEFRRALLSLEGPGTAVADMTSLWGDMMKRKTHYDLTGNGLNHPNDFSHRLYAMIILSLLNDTTSRR
jgi:acyl-CoA thioesterase I